MAKRNAFTHDEIVLCIYAARYDIDDIGGIDAINTVQSRSRSSIRMKIQNIVAMCDEEGVSRNSNQHALTGLPAGETGRRTNWDELSQYVNVPQSQHLNECQLIIAKAYSWPGELADGSAYREGSKRQVVVNAYERDPVARQTCIDHYGPTCVVCGFNFLAVFGPEADGFIHVHHLTPLSEIGTEYTVDPINDLRPVCPNCHAVIHLGSGTKSIDEVREMLHNSCTTSTA
jgi:hypothetical protein